MDPESASLHRFLRDHKQHSLNFLIEGSFFFLRNLNNKQWSIYFNTKFSELEIRDQFCKMCWFSKSGVELSSSRWWGFYIQELMEKNMEYASRQQVMILRRYRCWWPLCLLLLLAVVQRARSLVSAILFCSVLLFLYCDIGDGARQ